MGAILHQEKTGDNNQQANAPNLRKQGLPRKSYPDDEERVD